MADLPKGWEDAALDAADLDMSSNESPRQFAKLIAIRTANRLAQLQDKQREPEVVEFRAARRKGANYPEMLHVTETLNPAWEWLDHDGKPQTFKVVLS